MDDAGEVVDAGLIESKSAAMADAVTDMADADVPSFPALSAAEMAGG